MSARIALALLLAVGFYCLALGIAGALLFLVYAIVVIWERIFLQIIIPSLIGAAVILWSILPRLDRFEPPGPLLKPEGHPALFAEIERVAGDVHQPMPREVYLVPDVNAFVMQRGGIMGIGSKRVMGIGLALLASLTTPQFKAVLAHEFGHYHGGDTKLAPWIYKTRLAIIRTVQELGGSWLQLPFVLYANLFLILTEAVSRRQEYRADQLAAQAYGTQAIADGLKKVSGMGPAFDGFFEGEMLPVLSAGYRPPLVEGFRRFVEHQKIALLIDQTLEEELEKGVTDPFDTHPSLKERIAALGEPPEPGPSDDAPALGLLNNLPEMEQALFSGPVREQDGPALKPVDWENVGETALVPLFREIVRDNRTLLSGITAQALPERVNRLMDRQLPLNATGDDNDGQTEEEKLEARKAEAGRRRQIVGMALTSWLVARGFAIDALPGDEVSLIQGEVTVLPFSLVEELASGTMSSDDWRSLIDQAGIADVDLGQSPVQ